MDLYKINQIAGLYGISCDTIRIYERMGFFSPAYVDPKTKYRYYGIEEILKLEYILQLKGLSFSLCEIKKVLSNILGMEEKREMLLAQFQKVKELLGVFDKFLNPPDYAIKLRKYPRHYIVSNDISVSSWKELLGEYVDLTSLMIKHKLKYKPFSHPYAVFEDDFSYENFSCRICFEVLPDSCQIIREIPAQTFITLTHKGSYETLGESYKRLSDHAAERGIALKNYAVERYIVTYDNSALSSEYITEIDFPLESKNIE